LREELSALSVANPDRDVRAGQLAYLIYTSGSTGRPKGVAIEHRSAVAMLEWASREFGPESRACVLASTSICFDLSVFELFLPLCHGGSVWLVEDALGLIGLGPEAPLSMINTVPSAMAELARAGALPGSAQVVNLAGEALGRGLVTDIYLQGGVEKVYNLYGPSEDTTYSTYCLVERESGRAPTIGRPIANTQVYLVDWGLNPTPVGVAGELLLGGAGLARGYLNGPELTAEKFVPNPFSSTGGERLYRTGDLARYLPDGQIEFLGRLDHQVKIRGFRIELGEIEEALRVQAGVGDAAVVAREEEGGKKRLVAYVVGEGEEEPSVSRMREALRQKLPEYMVPASWVVLESMPLTPNGKVDRKALLAPDQSRNELSSPDSGPHTPIEEMLAGIWREVLGLARVGAHDNFFELGGHSLLAAQVISRLREAFQVEIALRRLFEHPTVEEMARVIDDEIRGGEVRRLAPIKPLPRATPPPLSITQQRLWFIDQLEPGSPVYNIPSSVHLAGALNIEALKAALDEVARRHETLRTIFPMIEGRAVQMINSPRRLQLPIVDLTEIEGRARRAEMRGLVSQEAWMPFDLGRGPLLRACLLKLGAEEYVALFTIHHIVSDAWSMGVLIKEVSALYEAYAEGSPSHLPELSIQYADYAHWQREWLQGAPLEEQAQYWKRHLGGNPPLLELPTDRPRPAVQSFQGASQTFALDKSVSEKLKELSQRQGVTLFMTLLAGFQVLLSRYSGQEEIVVGTPIAGRNRIETEGLIGFFINTLILRTDLSGDPTFAGLLQRVREVTLGAYAHQDLPFEKLVEELQPERDLSRQPLFQVMFVLRNVPQNALRMRDLKLDMEEPESKVAKFDLTLSIVETKQGLTGAIVYKTDLFDEERIRRMSGHLGTLLEDVARNPNRRISELEILTETERRQLLREWNDTRSDFGKNRLIHEVFHEQAKRQPEALAAVFDRERLTYRDLNRRANQLANFLQGQGVGPEVVVGICVERSLEMLVGLLGILKAGGAYAPLDPGYPKQRLAFILEDTQIKTLVTQESLLEKLPGRHAKVVCLDRDWEVIERSSQQPPISTAGPDNLAYVIHTSGSTGRPKGIMVDHKSIANYLGWIGAEMLDDTVQSAPLVQSLAFDGSLKQIFPPLLRGSHIWLLPTDALSEPILLLEAMSKRKNLFFSCVPSLWKVIIDAVDSNQATLPDGCITSVFVGGEELNKNLVDRTYAALRRLQIWNFYGPSETTGTASVAKVNPGSRVTIGRPIAGKKIYLLDKYLNPVPIGVPGELYIGGEGLARGYFSRPDLTAEYFIPDPFGEEQGARLYRTRDLARYASTGDIEFLGRVDRQVKLRGYRIELGEIEAVLSQHPGVREAVVVAREDSLGDKRLVAYLVVEADGRLTEAQLRGFLKQKLPEYMAPGSWIFLDALPLTPNGKVDHRALPVPERSPAHSEREYVAPRNHIEEVIANIWAEALGVERVSVESNFFELGGHSLLATQIVARLREAFRTELLLRSLFESPTIAGMAEICARVEIERADEDAWQLLNLVSQLPEEELKTELGKRILRHAQDG